MTKPKMKTKHKVLRKYLISFILVFIIPSVVIVLFFNQYTSNVIGKKAENELRMNFLRRTDEFEKRLSDVINDTTKISLDSETLWLANTDGIDPEALVRMSKYSREVISEYFFYNNYIKNIAVYFNKRDIVITEKGKYDFYNYFEKFYKYNKESTEKIKNLLQKPSKHLIMSFDRFMDSDTDISKSVEIVHSFPGNNSRPKGSIILSLDSEGIKRIMGLYDPANGGNFLLLDENANALVSMNENVIPREKIIDIMGQKQEYPIKITVNGTRLAVFCQESNLNKWWYMYFLPEEEMISGINEFRKLMLIIIILYITIGLCISLLLSLLNYSPIRDIIDEILSKNALKASDNKTGQSRTNEYDIIKKYINDLYNEKNDLSSKINIHLNEVKSNFLRELIIEGMNSSKFSSMSEMLNLKFPYKKYCFFSFAWDNTANNSSDEVNKAFFILNAIEEMSSKFGIGYKLSLQKDVKGIILNIKDEVCMDDIIIDYVELVRYLDTTYNSKIRVGAGTIHDGFENIHKSFREADEALKYCIFYQCSVFSFDDAVKTEHSKYFYPSKIKEKLINMVEFGDYESTEKLLAQIINNNFSDRKLSLNLVYKLYYELMGTLSGILDKYNINVSRNQIEANHVNNYDDNFRCLGDMIDNMKNAFEMVCTYTRDIKEKSTDYIGNDIINFIKENYCDPNLSCYYVADKFKISQPYLSHIIKKFYGMSYGQYVNHLRIEEAKILLKKNDISVKEITSNLGYGSSSSFIRTFKNIVGITPGQYKSMSDS